jgi:hypothetical protein
MHPLLVQVGNRKGVGVLEEDRRKRFGRGGTGPAESGFGAAIRVAVVPDRHANGSDTYRSNVRTLDVALLAWARAAMPLCVKML